MIDMERNGKMTAYLKKECMELTRTGRLLILGIIFLLLGIMNPAIAKLTPWLYETMQDSFAEQGLVLGEVTVNAMTSWTQFFKNALMAVIVMALMSSSSFTGEYQKGTLIQVVTKGLSRRKIFFSKLLMGYATWTMMLIIYSGVTWGYNMFFWGDDEVHDVFAAIILLWLFGILLMSLLSMFGALAGNSGHVLLGTGGVFFIAIVLGYVPSIEKYLPMKLMDGLQLMNGTAEFSDFSGVIILSSILIVICAIIGMAAFDRKKL